MPVHSPFVTNGEECINSRKEVHFKKVEKMDHCTRKGNLFLTRGFAVKEDAAILYPVFSCRKQLAREVPVQVRRGLGSNREPL